VIVTIWRSKKLASDLHAASFVNTIASVASHRSCVHTLHNFFDNASHGWELVSCVYRASHMPTHSVEVF